MFDLDKTIHINLLLDFYGSLLTEKQKTVMTLYFADDLSLAEIAEQHEISRNAVHDNINRTIKILENYEKNLQLLHKFQIRSKLYDEIREKFENHEIMKYVNQLEELE